MKYFERKSLLLLDQRRKVRWNKDVERRKSIKQNRQRNRERKLQSSPTEIVITPPKHFNFSEGYSETVSCLERLRGAVVVVEKGEKRLNRVFIDLEQIEELSVAGALVLAAEMDRWKRYTGKRVVPRRLTYWKQPVRDLLLSLGFFDLLNLTQVQRETLQESVNQITILPMISRQYLDSELLSSLSSISNFLHGDPTIYGALVEAAYNAMKHAYPQDHRWKYETPFKGWWATASWDPEKKQVKFLVFDQGVGIAETLPRWEGWETIRGVLAMIPAGVGELLHDESNMIKAAMEVDRSSLKGGHGKGLQDIIEVVRGFDGARVRILSGRGSVLYDADDRVHLQDNEAHIGGTLVEWTIPVRADEE